MITYLPDDGDECWITNQRFGVVKRPESVAFFTARRPNRSRYARTLFDPYLYFPPSQQWQSRRIRSPSLISSPAIPAHVSPPSPPIAFDTRKGTVTVRSSIPQQSRGERSAQGFAHMQVRRCGLYTTNAGGLQYKTFPFWFHTVGVSTNFRLPCEFQGTNRQRFCSITHRVQPDVDGHDKGESILHRIDRIGSVLVLHRCVWYTTP